MQFFTVALTLTPPGSTHGSDKDAAGAQLAPQPHVQLQRGSGRRRVVITTRWGMGTKNLSNFGKVIPEHFKFSIIYFLPLIPMRGCGGDWIVLRANEKRVLKTP